MPLPSAQELFPDSDSGGDKKSALPKAQELFPDAKSESLGETTKKAASELTPFVAGKVGNIEALAAEDAKKAEARLLGREPGVDYDSGLPLAAEIGYSRADTKEEKKIALQKSFPNGAVKEGKDGTFYVETPDGKKIAAGEGAFWTKRLPAGLISSAEPLAGMIGGAAGGAEVGLPFAPFTFGASVPIGAIVGAGIFGAAGKEVQEQEKKATGYYAKTPQQHLDALNSEALWSAGGEGVGRLLLGAGRASRQFPEVLGDQTPETKRLGEESLKVGARPPIRAVAPGATKSQWMQTFYENVIGNHREAKNEKALEGQIKTSLKASGLNDEQVNQAFNNLATGKVDSRAFGEEMTKTVKDYKAAQEASISTLNKNMDKVLDEQFKTIEKDIGSPSAALPEMLKTDIETARETFSQSASTIYGKVDELAGSEPVVPTSTIKAQASKIIDMLPAKKDVSAEQFAKAKEDWRKSFLEGKLKPGQKPPTAPEKEFLGLIAPGAEGTVRYLRDLTKLEDKITFKQAQNLRSGLNQIGLATDLTPGFDKKVFRDLANSVDGSIKDGSGGMNPEALSALQKADKFYKDNIKKFKNVMAIKLTREAGQRGAIDPEAVLNLVAKPGYESRLRYIMKMVNPETQKAIVAQDFSHILTKSTNPVTNTINGKSLLKQLAARDKTGEILYGKNFGNLKNYAQKLAAKNGDLPVESLSPDTFSKTLAEAVKKQDELERFMSKGDNYLATLSKNDFEFNNAVDFVIQPGKEVRLENAIEFFGEKSPITNKLRQQALIKIFGDAAGGSTEPIQKALQGGVLKKELSKYSDRQLNMLFPNGLAGELKNMADVVEFYGKSTAKDTMAAGLAAGVVKHLPIFLYAPVAAWSYAWDGLFRNPRVLRWYGPGLHGDNMATETMNQLFKNVPRSYIQSFSSTDDD